MPEKGHPIRTNPSEQKYFNIEFLRQREISTHSAEDYDEEIAYGLRGGYEATTIYDDKNLPKDTDSCEAFGKTKTPINLHLGSDIKIITFRNQLTLLRRPSEKVRRDREQNKAREISGDIRTSFLYFHQKSLPLPERQKLVIHRLQHEFEKDKKMVEGMFEKPEGIPPKEGFLYNFRKINWKEVEKALQKSPELIATIEAMQHRGGNPRLLGLNWKREYVFVESSGKTPNASHDVSWKDAHKSILKLGDGAKPLFVSEFRQLKMLKGNIDEETWTYLATSNPTGNEIDYDETPEGKARNVAMAGMSNLEAQTTTSELKKDGKQPFKNGNKTFTLHGMRAKVCFPPAREKQSLAA